MRRLTNRGRIGVTLIVLVGVPWVVLAIYLTVSVIAYLIDYAATFLSMFY